MRVGFVEWPEGLSPSGPGWSGIADSVSAARLDLLVTNELPFGRWIAEDETFDSGAAQESIDTHAEGLGALALLDARAVLTSRPAWSGNRLINEAVVIAGGQVRVVHAKQYFPEEPGWHEARWYRPGSGGFLAADAGGLRTGVMLCTDAMFNEHARALGRQGAALIAIPRATGEDAELWLTAGKMAAIVSGSYVVSSNRAGRSRGGVTFGGPGFAFAPDGTLLATTEPAKPLAAIDVDPDRAARQRNAYPCYVREQARA